MTNKFFFPSSVLILVFVTMFQFGLNVPQAPRNKTWINFLKGWIFRTDRHEMLQDSFFNCKGALRGFAYRVKSKLFPKVLTYHNKIVFQTSLPLGRLLGTEMKQPMTVYVKQYTDLGMNVTFYQLQLPFTGLMCEQEYIAVHGHFNRKNHINPLGPFCGIKNVFYVFSSHFEIVISYVHRLNYCTLKQKFDIIYQVIDAEYLHSLSSETFQDFVLTDPGNLTVFEHFIKTLLRLQKHYHLEQLTGKYLHPLQDVLFKPNKSTHFLPYLFNHQSHLHSFHIKIQVNKYQRLYIKSVKNNDISAKIKTYDGPGTLSPMRNKTHHIKLTSFQAAIVILSKFSENKIDIDFHAVNECQYNLFLNTTFTKQYDNVINNYFVYNFTSEASSFLNLTVLSLHYEGSNEVLCSFGGIVIMDLLFAGIYSVFDSESPKELRTVCGPMGHLNYYPGKDWHFSHISTGNSLLFSLYAYKYYSKLSINFTATPVKCVGLTLDVACLHSTLTNDLSKNPLMSSYFKLRNKQFQHNQLIFTVQRKKCVTIQLVENRVMLYRYRYRYRYTPQYYMKERHWHDLVSRVCRKHYSQDQVLYFLNSKTNTQHKIALKFELNPVVCFKPNKYIEPTTDYTSYNMDLYGTSIPKFSSFEGKIEETPGYDIIYTSYSTKKSIRIVKKNGSPSFHHLEGEVTQMILHSLRTNYWTQKSFSLTVVNKRNFNESDTRVFEDTLEKLNFPSEHRPETSIEYSSVSHAGKSSGNTLTFSYYGEPAKVTTSYTFGLCRPNCTFGFLKYYTNFKYHKLPLATTLSPQNCLSIALPPAENREDTSLSYEANRKVNCSKEPESCFFAMHVQSIHWPSALISGFLNGKNQHDGYELFHLAPSPLSWLGAEQRCVRTKKSHLLSIHSSRDITLLQKILSKHVGGNYRQVYIGLAIEVGCSFM